MAKSMGGAGKGGLKELRTPRNYATSPAAGNTRQKDISKPGKGASTATDFYSSRGTPSAPHEDGSKPQGNPSATPRHPK